jgi:hypothetical protein
LGGGAHRQKQKNLTNGHAKYGRRTIQIQWPYRYLFCFSVTLL